ncbi:hypothetical protein ARMGADRAFT_1165779 [Armillaria gallica]|uniref:F-box domain-containing protein n=1 Tax=Armillaria gallica TaxID=47427 RepID=A0A2H3DBY5_ARMGA|nr:hypothetical protein ARMGADRAFT_1165779 [Armillaria gallica]
MGTHRRLKLKSESSYRKTDRTVGLMESDMRSVVGYRYGPHRDYGYYLITGRLKEVTSVMDPVTSLGRLDLPLELLDIIVSQYCDIQTLVTSFSLVNRRARVIVSSSLVYQRIRRHAKRALVAMLRTKAASFYTLADVYGVLCGDPYCTKCGDFGPLLWLPECRRCCMSCLREAPDLMPISRHAATKALGIPKSTLARLPTVCTVPGGYGWGQKTFKVRRQYLSFRHAVEIAGGEAQCMARVSASPQRQAAYDAFKCAQTKLEENARYMVATPLPYFDKRSGKADRGIRCRGCQRVLLEELEPVSSCEQQLRIRRHSTVYVAGDFIRHIQRDCPEGKQIWERHLRLSKGSTESVSQRQ